MGREVAGDDTVHAAKDGDHARFVVLLELDWEGVCYVGIEHPAPIAAELEEFSGNVICGADKEIVIVELQCFNVTTCVATDVKSKEFRGGDTKWGRFATCFRVITDSGALDNDVSVACTGEIHVQNGGHDWASVGISEAETEDFVGSAQGTSFQFVPHTLLRRRFL
ncbi:MAG: hypothetical protein A2664_03665 [Candidatus Taylorbacteria bacterium RIFCSPHIGHO2_01_FULL_46_22b]|uniref:Uncharacterized protein n=1 Tax=Candidatus Taylorbacteria bacterium RIFCSPHIGHO2_01_FULL_46_22b TaxID=1802301 RepID=A0A1G2M1C6_9BACT|nr:MAG: hypothetical protein A2664_03665 [Candidatus Taylorbacteria bacterium RIFCSPHIGHO2_01_FULL_46_22b]